MACPSPQLAFDGRPVEHQTSPLAPLDGLTPASLILCLCGTGLGLAAGHYATESHDDFNASQGMDRVMAQLYGFFGIAAFATAIPLLA